jgi:hypothetical protein
MLSGEYQIAVSHQPEPGQPLVVSQGDILTYKRKPTEWRGWLWCSNHSGGAAWVPETYVEIEGSACRMTRDYTSRELAVAPGETVVVEFEESGWVWVTKTDGESGWIPIRCLSQGV